MEYPIWNQNEIIGTAHTFRCGLYMEIQCTCQYPEGGFFRVHMKYPDKTIDLGLWVKVGQNYSVRRKIPIKSLGAGDPIFSIVSNITYTQEPKYPICTGLPFEHIDKIRKGKLLFENGAVFLVGQSNL